MRNLEELFIKEFKSNVKTIGSKDIYSISLPESVKSWEISGTELYAVKDIDDEYYGKLNKSIVKRLPNGMEVKRREIDKATRSFAKDADGNFIYSKVTIPSGSIVVISEKSIGLPFKYKKEGYGYVDFVQKGEVIEYLYILPKTVLYKVNQTALAISVKNMKNFKGMGYLTWKHGVIFIHVIPYNPKAQYVGSKILKTGVTLNYSAEISEIVCHWIQQDVVPDLSLCNLMLGENIALKPTIVGYVEYEPVEILSLGDKELYGANENENSNGSE